MDSLEQPRSEDKKTDVMDSTKISQSILFKQSVVQTCNAKSGLVRESPSVTGPVYLVSF